MRSVHQSTKLFSAMLIIITTIAFSFPLVSCSQSNKEVSIDGKKFTVLTMESGKPETAALETITFNNGMFDNEGCHIYGFGNGKYMATKNGDNYSFEATTTSPKEGTMKWKGMVMGDVLHGEMVWHKDGQADIHYTFNSADIKMSSLDGKTYTTQMKSGDSMIVEEVTFKNGVFDSPGCMLWGFAPAPYQAWEMNGKIMWQSLYTSSNEGMMLFTGSATGNEITINNYWVKEGQNSAYETSMGTLKQ